MSVADLEAAGNLQFLLFLYPNKRIKISDIDIKGSRTTLYSALGNLLRLGLVSEERVPPYTRFIKLTEQGQKVAEKISDMEKILQAETKEKSLKK
jgi:DNA-binding PadR family transcriptional regulator